MGGRTVPRNLTGYRISKTRCPQAGAAERIGPRQTGRASGSCLACSFRRGTASYPKAMPSGNGGNGTCPGAVGKTSKAVPRGLSPVLPGTRKKAKRDLPLPRVPGGRGDAGTPVLAASPCFRHIGGLVLSADAALSVREKWSPILPAVSAIPGTGTVPHACPIEVARSRCREKPSERSWTDCRPPADSPRCGPADALRGAVDMGKGRGTGISPCHGLDHRVPYSPSRTQSRSFPQSGYSCFGKTTHPNAPVACRLPVNVRGLPSPPPKTSF